MPFVETWITWDPKGNVVIISLKTPASNLSKSQKYGYADVHMNKIMIDMSTQNIRKTWK